MQVKDDKGMRDKKHKTVAYFDDASTSAVDEPPTLQQVASGRLHEPPLGVRASSDREDLPCRLGQGRSLFLIMVVVPVAVVPVMTD